MTDDIFVKMMKRYGISFPEAVLRLSRIKEQEMRSVPEWVAKHDDQAVPPRVKDRVAERYEWRCALCFQQLVVKGMEVDHIIAIENGGTHTEGNLQPLCRVCHRHKSRLDVLAKKRMAAARKHWLGIKNPSARPVPGSRNTKWAKRYNRTTGRFETVRRDE